MQDTQKNFYNKILGRIGEAKARRFLKKKGYKIIEKNYATKFGEVDLIGLYKDFLVFIEVKTRTNYKFGNPMDAVTKTKQDHYKMVCRFFCYTNRKYDNYQPRFDVIEVIGNRINHIEDAFQ